MKHMQSDMGTLGKAEGNQWGKTVHKVMESHVYTTKQGLRMMVSILQRHWLNKKNEKNVTLEITSKYHKILTVWNDLK